MDNLERRGAPRCAHGSLCGVALLMGLLCALPFTKSTGQGHLLVTPGSIPLHSAPGIPDPNEGFHIALVGDLGGE